MSGVRNDDQAMNAAILKARESVGEFIRRLEEPPPAQSRVSLKLPLTERGEVEHVWITDVHHASGRFWGRINNHPAVVTSWQVGDSITVAADEISDWMAIDNGRLVGGYTIRALRDRMPDDERAAFDQSIDFRVD